jgi:hypothetical protein
MTDVTRLFQAFLAPAIFVSATALLIRSINVRLMGIVSRFRQYVHAKHDAAKGWWYLPLDGPETPPQAKLGSATSGLERSGGT